MTQKLQIKERLLERGMNMAKTVKVPVKKEIWYWALRESQKDEDEILYRFPKIDKWIAGEESPTFKELEKVANYLKVPFGYMFLESPPKYDVMEIEFRSINNKLPEMSKKLKDTIMEMDSRRKWMSDYRKGLGWEKLDAIVDFSNYKSGNILDDALLAKKLLDLDDYWYDTVKSYDEAYNLIRDKLEEAGILVMRNGVVGMNNWRRLDINEFRAFMLYDDVSPLIFINNNDTKAGKIFSLIHECMHVLFEQEDVFLDTDINGEGELERYINSMTAEVLMPQAHIYRFWDRDGNTLDQIDELSYKFKVSKLALAIKLKDISLIDDKIVAKVRRESIENFEDRETGSKGGDFYRTYDSRISPVFKEAVIRRAEMGELSYTYAFKLLGGIKGKTYDKLKKNLIYYG